jgi:anti-sigma regulatory factor (Ser/Thr protein kinase)/anti-anti-sigma regulatory factor
MRDFPARMSEIQEANAFLVRALDGYPGLELCQPTLFDLRLAITETFANIVEHSYGSEPGHFIHMTVRVTPGTIEILFEDSGRRPDPRHLRSRSLDEYRERGLGLFLMSRCMDEVEFRFLRDGTNRLRICRFVDGATPERRTNEHQPFHIAIYERLEAITIRPIGALDRSRSDPFPRTLVSEAPRITLDLADLDFLDEWGAERLAAFAESAREKGRTLEVAPPSPEIERILIAAKVVDRIAPDGWIDGDVAYVDETPLRIREADRIGRAMPLLRSAGSPRRVSLAEHPEVSNWLAPSTFHCGRLDVACSVPRSVESPLWIVRGAPGEIGEVLFIAAVRLDTATGPLAAAELRSAIGGYPDFLARLRDCTVTAFIQRLSSGLRDLLPGLEPSGPDPCLLMAAVEFLENSVRAIGGLGPVLASVNGRNIRSVLMGGSENAVIETLPVSDALPGVRGEATSGPPLRIFLSAVEAEERRENGLLDVWRTAP